jgi:hypothetical protein
VKRGFVPTKELVAQHRQRPAGPGLQLGPTIAKAVPGAVKNMIPQGVKDWAHTDPHAALRAGNPSPPPDNTGCNTSG